MLRGRGRGRGADVVDALEHDQPRDSALGQHITVHPPVRVRAEAVVEHAVPAGRLVEHGDVGGVTVRLQPSEQVVRPAVVQVGGRATAVGQRVTQDRDPLGVGTRPHLDAAEEVPVRHRGRAGQVQVTDVVARQQIGAGPGTGMRSLQTGPRLSQVPRPVWL